MLFQEIVKNIGSSFFTIDEPKKPQKIIPRVELEDAELGNVIKKIQSYQNNEFELREVLQNPDLELGFGPVVETTFDDVLVHVSIFEQKYLPFIESINYLIKSCKTRDSQVIDYKMNKSVSHIHID